MDDDEAFLDAELLTLLADSSLWADPDTSVEHRVLDAIHELRSIDHAERPRRWWRDPRITALVGAAAAALVVSAVFVARHDQSEARDDATITMIGTDAAPEVRGEAGIKQVTSGVRIYVRVPGLPRRDGGEFYQGWLRSCDGERLAPIGTFHDLADAIGWAGVDIHEFPVLSFTREVVAAPQSPEQGSSGDAVVRGELAPCP
jgi:Anti-sigma-K factor rskA